ncbi:MAG: VanZ family protein, partial [Actinobacteria bacterium]
VWAGVIFRFSAMPGSQVPGRFGTVAHFAEYAILGSLVALASVRTLGRAGAVLLGISVAAGYAATDELHQAFVPMRTPDIADWLVDTAGALTGSAVAAALVSALRRRARA